MVGHAQVDTIYARADCAWLPPAGTVTSLDELPGASVPIALRLGPPDDSPASCRGNRRHGR